jgi:hypothetical protein
MNPEQQQDIVRAVVSDYFDKYAIQYVPYTMMNIEKEHIIDTGTSIMCDKWHVGYPPGDFAKAVVDNDLAQAFGRADDINIHCIRFYVMLMYNVGAPTSLFQ